MRCMRHGRMASREPRTPPNDRLGLACDGDRAVSCSTVARHPPDLVTRALPRLASSWWPSLPAHAHVHVRPRPAGRPPEVVCNMSDHQRFLVRAMPLCVRTRLKLSDTPLFPRSLERRPRSSAPKLSQCGSEAPTPGQTFPPSSLEAGQIREPTCTARGPRPGTMTSCPELVHRGKFQTA